MEYISITPVMTTDDLPSPYHTTAESVYSGSYPAWQAMDGSSDSCWIAAAGANGGWHKVDLGVANACAVTQITMRILQDYRGPKDFTFAGSNNDSSWTTLLTKTGETWTSFETRSYTFANTTSYRYYRIDVSAIQTPPETTGFYVLDYFIDNPIVATTNYLKKYRRGDSRV